MEKIVRKAAGFGISEAELVKILKKVQEENDGKGS
jgi:hypothetical protein